MKTNSILILHPSKYIYGYVIRLVNKIDRRQFTKMNNGIDVITRSRDPYTYTNVRHALWT